MEIQFRVPCETFFLIPVVVPVEGPQLYYCPQCGRGCRLTSGQCAKYAKELSKCWTGLLAPSPATLHDKCPPELSPHSAQEDRVVYANMDPQLSPCFVFCQKWVQIWDLLIMFFCSFLSRMDVKNTMVRSIPCHHTNFKNSDLPLFCGMLVKTNVTWEKCTDAD